MSRAALAGRLKLATLAVARSLTRGLAFGFADPGLDEVRVEPMLLGDLSSRGITLQPGHDVNDGA